MDEYHKIDTLPFINQLHLIFEFLEIEMTKFAMQIKENFPISLGHFFSVFNSKILLFYNYDLKVNCICVCVVSYLFYFLLFEF